MRDDLEFASLGSGSKGNATLIRSRHSCVLIDCGFSASEATRRLERLDLSATEIDAVLLTHEHSDHSSGAVRFCRRFDIPLYTSWGTKAALENRGVDFDKVRVEFISDRAAFLLKDIEVLPVLVPHDAREPLQFVLRCGDLQFGILTDLGSISPHVVKHYRACDALLLECNHDTERLRLGPYPQSLKERVAGDWGHLSNRQAGALLNAVELDKLQHLVVAHISEKNNDIRDVEAALACVDQQRTNVVIADQNHGFDWLSIKTAAASASPVSHAKQTHAVSSEASLEASPEPG